MTSTLRKAVRFFADHAGYATPPGRMACALELARAEQWAREQDDLTFVWQDDPDCTADDFDFESDKEHVREHGAVGCILYRQCPDHGVDCKHADHLASLWCITESLNNRDRDNYRRVVEAELASEALNGR